MRQGKLDYTVDEDNLRGVVKWFDKSKNYGFIALDDGRKDVFLHANHAGFEPREGDKVKLSLATDRNARSFAVEVELA